MSMQLFSSNFGKIRVLLIGDVMLDKYVFGNIDRISPEAPVPVFLSKNKKTVLGGAGNVLNNLSSLGAAVTFLSVIGKDLVAKDIKSKLKKNKLSKCFLYEEKKITSTSKTRYLTNNQQIIRIDEEESNPIPKKAEEFILDKYNKEIKKIDVVILSDYNKGVLTGNLCKRVIEVAKRYSIPVIVDPKNKDFSIYKGSTLITPNQKEAAEISKLECDTNEQAEKCSKYIIENFNIKNVIITRGEKGLTFYNKKKVIHAPTKKIEVYDVSGAGDTVISIVSLCVASSFKLEDTLSLANKAAGIVVGKLGTSTIEKSDLLNNKNTYFESKVLNVKELLKAINNDKQKGLKVGFTNGCFDIIHNGHISYLKNSKSLCDKLVVAINSDSSVKKIKGENRPINSQTKRAIVLEALSFIDYVVIFNDTTPLKLINKIRPDLITKGGDYKNLKIVGEDEIKKWGGKTYILEYVKGQSTTNILNLKTTN